MKMKSAAGVTLYVKDVEATAQFYETLGFQFKTREPAHATAYLNWYWMDFLPADQDEGRGASQGPQGVGVYFAFSVEDVDEAHAEVIDKGLRPVIEPRNRPGGVREFVLRDLDGYNLVFFKKK